MLGSAVFRTGVAPGGALAGPWVRNPLWTAARAVPSLDLRFADNKSLVDAATGQNLVTFTRASSGTYVDSQGVIKTATTNLLLRSEEFDNASWTKTNSTVTANATTAPNGALTAEKLITNSGASSGRVSVSITATADTPATLSCYAKQGETNIFGLFISDGITGRAADFNLTTGTVSGTPTAGMTASIQPVGDGWYRCVVTVAGASLSGTTRSLRIVQTVVANDGTSGLFIWGAQFEQSTTAGEYIPTTSTINSAPRFDHNPTTGESLGLLVEEQRTNLVTWSQDFSQADWSKAASTVVATAVASPIQGVNYQKIEATSANTTVGITSVAVTAATQQRAVSFFAQPLGNISRVLVVVQGADARININLADGTFVTNAAATGSTVSVSGQRFSVSTPTLTNATGVRFFLKRTGETDTNTPTTISIGEGLYLIGAQMEAGSFPTSYIPTTTATATRSADVASITGSNFGVSRTNLLLRSEEFGTTWTATRSSITADAATAPNNTLTADKLVEDTTATNSHQLQQPATIVANTTYTVSCFIKAAERSELRFLFAAGGDGINALFNLGTGIATAQANTGSGSIVSASLTPVGNGWFRAVCTGIVSPTSTAATLTMRLISSGANSYTGDGTSGLFIWGAQLETGSTATAYIPTTTAAVTVFESSWYRQDEGTAFAEAISPATSTTVFAISDGSTNNRIQIETGSNTRRFRVTSSGTSRYDNSVSYTLGTSGKSVGAYIVSGSNHATNGVLGVDLAGSPLPVVDRLLIGTNGAGLFYHNGTIRRLTYWPTRLPNETLQGITQ